MDGNLIWRELRRIYFVHAQTHFREYRHRYENITIKDQSHSKFTTISGNFIEDEDNNNYNKSFQVDLSQILVKGVDRTISALCIMYYRYCLILVEHESLGIHTVLVTYLKYW